MRVVIKVLLATLMPVSAAQGMMIDYIKVQCAPEKKSFQIVWFGSEEETWLTEKSIRTVHTKMHNGIFDPSNLHYTCSIGKDNFKLVANQAPMHERGYCAGAPEVYVTLLKNGKPIMGKHVLGDSCLGMPTIDSVKVNAGKGIISICSESGDRQKLCKDIVLGRKIANSPVNTDADKQHRLP